MHDMIKLVSTYIQIYGNMTVVKKTKRSTFLCVSYSWIIPQHGSALYRVGFRSLQLFWDRMTLKAPKLFPTVVHEGLVGHPDPHPIQATNGKGSI